MKGVIITKVDRVPDSCFDCEMHDDVDWCPFAREHVELYAKAKELNPRCPIKPVPEKKEITGTITSKYDGRVYAYEPYASGYNACIDEILGGAE